MTDLPPPIAPLPPDDGHPDEGLAAEYVLGTLPLPDRMAAEARAAQDHGLAARIAAWEAWLAPLNAGYAEVPPPPQLLPRIEARIFGQPARAPRWRLFAGLGLAAGLAAAVLVAVLPLATVVPPITAELTGAGANSDSPLRIAARYEPAEGRLTVSRSAGPPAPAGQDYELWVIGAGAGAVPQPLGVIRDATLVVPLSGLPAGSTLAVTLEPAGGSPSGLPTGPVLSAAVIAGG